jgi:hypothetical protein
MMPDGDKFVRKKTIDAENTHKRARRVTFLLWRKAIVFVQGEGNLTICDLAATDCMQIICHRVLASLTHSKEKPSALKRPKNKHISGNYNIILEPPLNTYSNNALSVFYKLSSNNAYIELKTLLRIGGLIMRNYFF